MIFFEFIFRFGSIWVNFVDASMLLNMLAAKIKFDYFGGLPPATPPLPPPAKPPAPLFPAPIPLSTPLPIPGVNPISHQLMSEQVHRLRQIQQQE